MTDIVKKTQKLDTLIDSLEEIIKGKNKFTRDGRPTLTKILSDVTFKPPIDYRSGIEINNIFTTVKYNEEIYYPKDEFIPFITSEEFDINKWNLIVKNNFFLTRNRKSLERLASYPDGTVVCIENLWYMKKNGYTGISSAGREYNIDNIKPLDDKNISPGHFYKYSENILNNQVGINYAIEYANSEKVCGGTIVLKNNEPYSINGPIKMLDGVSLINESNDVYSNENRLATLVINNSFSLTELGNRNDVLGGIIIDGGKGINIKGIEIDMENAPDRTIGILVAGCNYLNMENLNIFNVGQLNKNYQKPILFVRKDNLSLLYINIKNLFISASRDYTGIMCDIEHEKLYGGDATDDKRMHQAIFDNLRTLYGGTAIRLIKPGGSIKFNNLQMRKGNSLNKAFICEDPLNEKPQIYGGKVNGWKYAFPSNKVTLKDYLFRQRTIHFYGENENDLSNLENNKPDFSIGNDQSQYKIINQSGMTIHESCVIFQNKILKEDRQDYNQLDNKLILLSGKNFENKSAHYMCNLDLDIPDNEDGITGYLFQIYMRGKEILIRKSIGDDPIGDGIGLSNIDIDLDINSEYDIVKGNYKTFLLTNKSSFDIRVTFSVTGTIKTYTINQDGKYDDLTDDSVDELRPLNPHGDDIAVNPPVFF